MHVALRSVLFALITLLASCRSAPAPEPPPPAAPAPAPSAFRTPGPRAQETIFSPLPWRESSDLRLASGVPGRSYWQNRADYTIDVTLDEAARRLTGHETITYTNNSPHTLEYIWINLEQNLFNPSSKGARLTTPGGRFGNRDNHVGGFELGPVRRLDLPQIPSEADSANPTNMPPPPPTPLNQPSSRGPAIRELTWHVFDTVARLDLDPPLPPGGVLRLELDFAFTIPAYGSDRLGIDNCADGPVFQIAQWFPAICKYDDVNGWNHLPYLGQGEFYTDFGDYHVNITVPRSHIVVAPGILQNPEEVLTQSQRDRLAQASKSHDTVIIRSAEEVTDPASRPAGEGPLTWRFFAQNIRTFAFATSAAFIWDAAAVQGSSVNTLAQSAYPREALPLWSQSTDMLRFAIEGYNARWFEYPWPVATNVNGIVGGMEYPQIIFCRARREERGLWGVTTHEIGHNWFPMIVSNDERRYPWMDEGFNTFINYYSTLERYPDAEPGRGNARTFAPNMLEPEQQPMMTWADQVRPGRLGSLMYTKTAAGLVTLREYVLGPDRFDFAFRRYIREWAFKSPRPEDFFRTMQDATGEDLTWFWRGWFYETGTLDQGVVSVEHPVDDSGAPTGKALVTFDTTGGLVFPVEFTVTYDDGSSETRSLPVEAWFTTTRWTTQWDAPGKTIVKIELDPRGLLPDVNPQNDTWERPKAVTAEAPAAR